MREALQNARSGDAIIAIELQPTELDEEHVVTTMLSTGCGCHKGPASQPCSSVFSASHVLSVRASCAELTRNELDLADMGQLMAVMNSDSTTSTSRAHHRSRDRVNTFCLYFHCGHPICERMFFFLHDIRRTRLKNLKKSLLTNGITSRIHGNTKRTPRHALSLQSIEFVVRFIFNYAEQNGLLLPGKVPGYSRSDIKLLPSSLSKRGIWRVYQVAAGSDSSLQPAAYSTFTRLWLTLVPSVIIMRPMTDLCWQCQKNSSAILKSANAPEEENSETLRAAEEHIRIVQVERSVYNSTCEECSRLVRAHFTSDGKFYPPPPHSRIPANFQDINVHYSFDYAHQVSSYMYI